MYQNVNSGYVKYYIEYAQIVNSGNRHQNVNSDYV